MTRAEAIEKLRKLLALADPTKNDSTGESTAAYRRACLMMKEHRVTLEDVFGTPGKSAGRDWFDDAAAELLRQKLARAERDLEALRVAAKGCGRRHKHTGGACPPACQKGKTQSTRMLKLTCDGCGAILRTTQSTLDRGGFIVHTPMGSLTERCGTFTRGE